MKQALSILLAVLAWSTADAGQQALSWSISTSNSVNQYLFEFAGPTTFQVYVTNRLTSSNTFTVPAGHWVVRAWAVTTNWGLSDPSNVIDLEVPQPITIRLNLSFAPSPEGPWSDDPDTPTWIVAATEERKFYKVRIER